MTAAVVLVLRSGGPYVVDDVHRLADQCEAWLPGARVICLSDVPVAPVARVPLDYDWPGWWAKMELYRPDLLGDFLFLDLDTIVRGPLDPFARLGRLALLRDFYRNGQRGKPDGLGSGLMFLPEQDRGAIWRAWSAAPAIAMQQCGIYGDQRFLERHWLKTAARLQDLLPGQVASYKASTAEERQAASVVCFHGKPKPRDVGWMV